MELSRALYVGLIAVVAALRLVELRVSKRNQRRLAAQGAKRAPDPRFPAMVALHTAVLAGAAAEVVFLRRPFYALLAGPMAALFLAANAVRWWVIHTLGTHWNVQVMDSAGLGVITAGPYRWVRHPNYSAVFVEMLALPLMHTAWIAAVAGSALHAWVLEGRIAAEERVLLADPTYRAAMGAKPRFLPHIF
jgi:methyltransferase